MEKSKRLKISLRLFLLAVFSVGMFPSSIPEGFAVKNISDKQKRRQWESMENGSWNFAPSGYYYLFHKGYSGATMRGLLMKIKFKESKSNVKRCITPRTAQIPAILQVKKDVETKLDSITPIYNEEMARAAERNVDVMYPLYKDDFKEMQDAISKCLVYCQQRSGGKLKPAIDVIERENDRVLAQIEYIHKTGPGYELENTKRQIAYEEAREQMKNLVKNCDYLVNYAQINY